MLTGGVPYYLERVEGEKSFIHAINDAFFLTNSNLLSEADEILKIEFNNAGCRTAYKILSMLGLQGKTLSQIVEISGLAKSTVFRTLDTLIEYKIIAQKNNDPFKPHQIIGIKYYIDDLFLNAYFQLFEKNRGRIEHNDRGLLFPSAIQLSLNGYYVPEFSGYAFEHLLRYILKRKISFANHLYQKLLLKEADYQVTSYEDSKQQIDLLVISKNDRIVRVIECKLGVWDKIFIDQVSRKNLNITKRKNYSFKKYLFISDDVSERVIQGSDSELIRLVDMFS
jgi:hypothetical protein